MYLELHNVTARQLIQAVYAHSRPQGLGFLHFERGPLSEEDTDLLIEAQRDDQHINLDYVNGRACKFYAVKRGENWYTSTEWYDHGESDIEGLLKTLKQERCEVSELVLREIGRS